MFKYEQYSPNKYLIMNEKTIYIDDVCVHFRSQNQEKMIMLWFLSLDVVFFAFVRHWSGAYYRRSSQFSIRMIKHLKSSSCQEVMREVTSDLIGVVSLLLTVAA